LKTYRVLEYQLVDDYIDRRGEFRTEHLTLAQAARERGELVMAGALAEPADRALLVWEADEDVVKAFAEGDPYVRNGLVERWTVRPWTVVVAEGVTPPGF
jgi:uncharacterized protein YciI